MKSPIEQAVLSGDIDALGQLLRNGADPNTLAHDGGTLLVLATSAWETNFNPAETVRLLLEAGANPNDPADDINPILSAIFNLNLPVIEMLLRYGANPNVIIDGAETLYEFAEFDYRYEEYELELPEPPSEADNADEEAWLGMLDRLARTYGKRPPAELHMLRAFGARTTTELERERKGR